MVAGPILPHTPNAISIEPAVFVGYLVVTSQTDTQTQTRTTPHVSSNRPHLFYAYDAAKNVATFGGGVYRVGQKMYKVVIKESKETLLLLLLLLLHVLQY